MSWISARVEHRGIMDANIKSMIADEIKMINKAAVFSAAKLQTEINAKVDRPTSFTQRAVGFQLAAGNRLQAVVYIGVIQSKYLRMIIEGGSSSQLKPVPGKGAENQYGNLPKNALKGAGNKGLFSIRSSKDGVRRVVRRDAGGLELVATWSVKRGYRRRINFREVVDRAVVDSMRRQR